MATFLFDSIVFGPVTSRRLGNSLGINLLPVNKKVCNFNCIYCECGLTMPGSQNYKLPAREEIRHELEKWLKNYHKTYEPIDSITFAGNGEPTLHPEFAGIITDTIQLRNRYNRHVKIAVLSNATMISNEKVFSALMQTDLNILKLDSGFEETIRRINCPAKDFNLDETVAQLKKFRGKLIIQTLFFRSSINNIVIDNTSPEEVEKWLCLMDQIKPESIMIYTIARETPVKGLIKANHEELLAIALKAEKRGFKVQISA
ncbi:MAG TPA: radical SAM protein [Caldithrix sp.]|nr:radical SAM protein [Bacteroidales bacterium]MBN2762398.1 radical SAM protein [Bacteroidales bacterium]HEM49482.1 radical SAM protein [Caldithrix sp.]